jgi:putative Ca2+/H+ antiporter (TMEM165/GDT1 family)
LPGGRGPAFPAPGEPHRGRPVNLAIAAAVFPVIFLGELPDKTMIASVVLSTRARPVPVWAGAAAAFCVHVALATTAGVVLLRVLPHRALGLVVAALFLAGAVLSAWEAWRAGKGGQPATPGAQPGRPQAHRAWWRPVITAFTVIFVAEWGDLTQILTASLAARYGSAFSVGLGSLLALWAVAALAVAGGRGISRLVNVTLLRLGTAAVLAGLAVYAGLTAAG